MTNTDLERRQTSVAITDDHYLGRIPAIAEQLANSSMCPDHLRKKPEDVAIIGYALADNGIRLSLNTLPQCFVVKGRPGYMAQIQTTMAAIHGIDLHPVDALCDDQSATVEMSMPNGQHYRVTFTMEEARKAKLHENPGNQYQLRPANMLVARAMTRAIDRHCPGVKLGLAGSINLADIGVADRQTDSAGDGQSAPDGERIVPAAYAKWKLLEAYQAKGIEEKQAVTCARILWDSHRYGSEPITPAQLDRLLALFFDTASEPAEVADTGPVPNPVIDSQPEATQDSLIEYQPDEEPF